MEPISRDGYRTPLSRVLVLCILATLVFASPAIGQGKPVFTSQEGPGYEVFKDGTLVIGGDVVGHCSAVGQSARQTGTAPGPELLRQVDICTEAGFPPRGSDALPDTGGPPFSTAAGALLLGTCALGFLGSRRRHVP